MLEDNPLWNNEERLLAAKMRLASGPILRKRWHPKACPGCGGKKISVKRGLKHPVWRMKFWHWRCGDCITMGNMLKVHYPMKLLSEALVEENYLLSRVKRDHSWRGGTIRVPFRGGFS